MSKVEITDEICREHNRLSNRKNRYEWRIEVSMTKLPTLAYRVAIILIDKFANDDGGDCYPSYNTLAELLLPEMYKTNMEGAKRNIQYAYKNLRNAGLIVTEQRGFNGSNYVYFAVPDKAVGDSRTVAYENDTGDSRTAPPGDSRTVAQATAGLHPNLTNNLTIEPDYMSVGAGERDGFAGPSDSFASIDARTLASCSDPVAVHVDIVKEKEETFNLYRAIRDGDAESIILMIENECGSMSDNWKSHIRKNMHDGTLNEKMINYAKRATIVDNKRAAA